ncbi:guanine nucleotide exchange factor [Boeremia exigua]|uniref:guanine nucleotide exchange factor n=1 Tax=Boeremia exigua TaxID=749465 RepID=UPI001E8CBAFF|nr:guanine nucleotide exchange factor [Boeremia exigua]KAH6633065.1 guanine nucleotide exchange factor [Boeremia exigua]
MMLSHKSGKAKLDHVTKILTDLKADLDAPALSAQQRQQQLEQLKVYGRDPTNADPIFTQDGLRTLGRYAFKEKDVAVSQEALRCMANALLLQPKARQILIDLGHGPDAAERLKSESIDDEFLVSRILFLTTYDAKLDYTELVDEHHLADNINAAIQRHADRYTQPRQPSQEHAAPMDLMALSETLKLLFNITHFHPDLSQHFTPTIPHIFKILLRRDPPPKPLDAPVSFLINALLNLVRSDDDSTTAQSHAHDPALHAALFPSASPALHATHLITLLDAATLAYPAPDLDTTISPLFTLLRRTYELAPADVHTVMQSKLLPSDTDRAQPLGKTASLPSRLLNLSTAAPTPALRDSVASFLFELSGKDAAAYVANVGYGFAAGFLLAKNIAMPASALRDAGEGAGAGVPVNPITGQRLDREEPVEMPEMTQEEKEREAERLFVLFERLKKTGVVDVRNPIEEMYRSGRVEELSDSE